jgi:hypothetical protein
MKKPKLEDGNSLMKLPEELRQKIILQMDPFDLHRLYTSATGAFKVYSDNYIWKILLKRDFPDYKYTDENLVWLYFSLYFSNFKYKRDHVYMFFYGDVFAWDIPSVQFLYELDYPVLYLYFSTNKFKSSNDRVWDYFKEINQQNLFKYDMIKLNHLNGYEFVLKPTTDIFKAVYLLFEMGFKLLDTNVYQKHFISQTVF